MPTVEANHNFWAGIYDWQGQGEEWSEAWGTSEAQWFSTLYPRIQAYIPPAPVDGFRILEIATGYGRWTQYLRQHCGSMIGVDLSGAIEQIDRGWLRGHLRVRHVDACKQPAEEGRP